MNHNFKSMTYSPFPWLEETLKNYQENIDYKIEWLNGLKHYTLLSDRLKKFVEEEWHQKILKREKGKYPENIVKWMKEELPKYQEGVDYRVEDNSTNVISGKKYIFLSERIKKGVREWNATQPKEDWLGFGDFDDFAHGFFHQGSADYHRQQEWKKKEIEEERQKFIAENDPPLLKSSYLYELDQQERLWNSQQDPLTEAEKAALNDPSLTYLGDWAEVLWYIQKSRQANSELYPDEYFAWEGDSKLKGQVLEVVQKSGVSLDKLFQRVEKSRQIKLRQVREKAQQDKATILANLDNWTVGADSIHNWKTTQTLTLTKDGNITRHRFFTEYAHGGKDSEEGIVEGCFDSATFQELRTAIFQNLLKNLRKDKNYSAKYQKKCGREVSEKNNYSPTEWTEIQKAMGETVPVSENSSQNSPNNSSLRNKLIATGIVAGLVILAALAGGLFLVRKRKKKNGSKR